MALVHKQRGGVWIGTSFFSCWKVTWPIGSIELYDDRVSLKAPPEKVVEIPLSEVTSVKKLLYIPLFAWGFRLNHKSDTASSYLIFWGFMLGKTFRFFQSKNIKFEN